MGLALGVLFALPWIAVVVWVTAPSAAAWVLLRSPPRGSVARVFRALVASDQAYVARSDDAITLASSDDRRSSPRVN
jgi:hypothetical protein